MKFAGLVYNYDFMLHFLICDEKYDLLHYNFLFKFVKAVGQSQIHWIGVVI